MSNVNKISKLADSYYLSAKTAQDNQLRAYFDTVMKQIASYAHACLTSTKHLISKPEHANSTGLKELLQVAPEIQTVCSQAKFEYADQALNSLNTFIGRGSFFSSTGNAGTGYDPSTSAKVEGYTPPGWYMNQMNTLYHSLKDRMQQSKVKPTAPLANT